jgi:hypothetical protein
MRIILRALNTKKTQKSQADSSEPQTLRRLKKAKRLPQSLKHYEGSKKHYSRLTKYLIIVRIR